MRFLFYGGGGAGRGRSHQFGAICYHRQFVTPNFLFPLGLSLYKVVSSANSFTPSISIRMSFSPCLNAKARLSG